MKSSGFVSLLSDSKARFYLCSLLTSASFLCIVYFTGSAFVAKDYRIVSGFGINCTKRDALPDKCKGRCRPFGSEALPEGIVSRTSNLEMRPLFGDIDEKARLKGSVNLLAMTVGIKQKALVNQIVQRFLENNFVIILFHYDEIVDEWNDLDWSVRAIHISAKKQTKWWFAKRFLHPDIVSEYEYIFLWDEDLGVENFHPGRYLSIAKEEGLEISQPALDPAKSVVHNAMTVRIKKSRVHRRYLKLKGGGRCYGNSTAPPCVGWVEMMAPVFSGAAWRCTWYMIQNDLIHAWGLDRQLGYCAQGDRSVKVGVIDEEYIVHLGIPTLGDVSGGASEIGDNRSAVRSQSSAEMRTFKRRWNRAVKEDKCWVDPY